MLRLQFDVYVTCGLTGFSCFFPPLRPTVVRCPLSVERNALSGAPVLLQRYPRRSPHPDAHTHDLPKHQREILSRSFKHRNERRRCCCHRGWAPTRFHCASSTCTNCCRRGRCWRDSLLCHDSGRRGFLAHVLPRGGTSARSHCNARSSCAVAQSAVQPCVPHCLHERPSVLE